MRKVHHFLFFFMLLTECMPLQATTYTVKTVAEFKAKVASGLKPKDTVLLANGVWRDADLAFKGQGTSTEPIVLAAETAGKVTLEGTSFLRIAGAFLVVEGLWFKNGGVNGAVVEYRISSDDIANDCRITNCVIDDYNKGNDRSKESTWIQFYGKRNRLDHCYIAGKKNGGVTLAVNLNDERHRENAHRLDHNVFGHRPVLGSNGGETIRIGVSTYSLTNSKTIVEDNYFYRCSGEVEIISVKSCENIVRRNVFYESEGNVVLRHGHRNLIEGNFFIGNNKPHTGGVRVINEGQRVVNNYFENLRGDRFRSALAVMNGVPNSALNRYNQVKDAVIAFNTFVNCAEITLAAGADNERTAKPISTSVFANFFINTGKKDSIYKAEDDISGINFNENQVKTDVETEMKTDGKNALPKGFKAVAFTDYLPKNKIKNTGGTAFVTTDILGNERGGNTYAGAFEAMPKNAFDFQPSKMKDVGTTYFQPDWANITFPPNRKTLSIPPQYMAHPETIGKAVEKAVETAEAGDIIELSDTGTYYIDAPMLIKKPITIQSKAGLSARPILKFKGEKSNFTFISIENGGSLRLNGINFNGFSGSSVAECAIRTSTKPMIEHYQLYVDNCTFSNFDDGRKSAFIAHKSTYADTIRFSNCLFYDISGEALSLASEKDDKGIYNVEHLFLNNCVFANLLIGALDLYRGGNDESTLGPFLTVDHCTFHNVGNVELGSVLKLMGVQWSDIQNTLFSQSGQAGRAARYEDSKGTRNKMHHSNLYKSGKVDSFYPNILGEGMSNLQPDFAAPTQYDFRQKAGSLLKNRATDGKDIGVN
jgi:poly(beta-D-mannuronate) lyase